jgi:hypothetical protein
MTADFILLFVNIAFGLLSIFLFNAFVNKKVRALIPADESTIISIDLLKAVYFLSSSILLIELASPSQTLLKVLTLTNSGSSLILNELSYLSLFYAISLLINVFIVWISFMMFSLIKKGSSLFMEVANNSYNALLLYSSILITLILVSKVAINPFCDFLIPYPSVPNFR